VTIERVPEPSTLALGGTSVGVLGVWCSDGDAQGGSDARNIAKTKM